MPEQTKLFQVFEAGTHVDSRGVERTFTEQDLLDMESNYAELNKKVPLFECHDPSRGKQGLIAGVVKQGKKLYAIAENIAEDFRAKIKNGWKFSVGLLAPSDPRNPSGKWALQEISGTPTPAIKGMEDPSPAFFDEGLIYITFSECGEYSPEQYVADGFDTIARIFRVMRDRMVEADGIKAADEVLPSYTIDYLISTAERIYQAVREQEPAMPISSYSEGGTMTKEELDAREAAIAAQEKELKERMAKVAAQEAIAFAEAQAASGKILPTQKAALAEIHKVLGDAPTIQFGEGAPKSERDLLTEFFEIARPVIEYGEKSPPESTDGHLPNLEFAEAPGQTVNAAQQAQWLKAKAYQAEHPGVDIVDAYKATGGR